MAEYEIYYIGPKSELPSDSRYKYLDVIRDTEDKEFFETVEQISIKETENDLLHQVTSGEKNRLDLIAYNYYGNAELWWVIAIANDIKNPFEIDAGDILRIPSIEAMYGYGGVLS